MEEKQAIDLLKNGDLKGLETLSRMYYYRAVKAAYLIIQSQPEAEDLVQNAFVHACEKIHQLNTDRFGPWFMRSVVNASIKAAVKQKRLIPIDQGKGEGSASLEDLLADCQPSPESITEAKELSKEVWRVLRLLSVEERTAVVLKYYLELSELDMTTKLHRPLSTIKWWLFSARRRMRQLLHPEYLPHPLNNGQSSDDTEKQK